MKNWIKEHKKACIIIGIVVIVLALVLIAGAVSAGKKQTDNAQETATVEKRTLMESVSATGTFVAADEDKITSDTTGVEVLAVNVEVGDTVAAGDVIAVLDSADLQDNLSDAKKNLSDTNEQTQRTRDSAKRNLEQAGKTRDEDLADVDTNIQDAYDEWQSAENNYNESVAAYNEAVAMANSITDKTSTAYTNANSQVNTLKRQMDTDRRTADSRKSSYDRQVSQREDTIKRINDTYQDQVDTYNNTMDSTEDSGKTQQERIDDLQEQIDGTVVKATASGLVTAVNVEVGDTYNGSVIAVIDNVDSFDITTEIDEYDINSIAVGQEVVIKTNATGDEELSGTVKKVSPIATGSTSGDLAGNLGGLDLGSIMGSSSSSSFSSSSNDDVTFTVTIALNTPSDKLRIGMTAKLNIVLQKNADVLSVPYNAVQTDDDGATYYVQKVTGTNDDGSYKTKKITVDKGIESDYYTEVINSGLKEGDEVLVPSAEKQNTLEDMINQSSSMGGV
mgnify:CR=1 FL=1